MFPWPWRKSTPKQAAADLRRQALELTASELHVSPTEVHPHVFGILMETAYPEAIASLVTFADGSASLYFNSGGGIIGAGEHASVRAALGPFFAAAEHHLSSFQVVDSTPLPARGRVRFYLRTFEGTLGAEADEQDLGNMRHALSPVFHAGHAVISAIRESSERAGAT